MVAFLVLGAWRMAAAAPGLATAFDSAHDRRCAAWALLPCEFGVDCARPEFGAVSRRIAAGLCIEGRPDAILFHGAWRSDVERAALGLPQPARAGR